MKTCTHLLVFAALALTSFLRAELKLPTIISDHMVLQQGQANPIWGWDTPGTKVVVKFGRESYTTTAGVGGKWIVHLKATSANAVPQTLSIVGTSMLKIQDVLVGEVWMCSGQSNMQMMLSKVWDGDLEAAAAKFPNLRLITVPHASSGTQEPKTDFQGLWRPATSETAASFSAVGFLYGRYIHEILGVPVGLIDNSWSGSSIEAWIRRAALEKDPRFQALMASIAKREADLLSAKGQADFERAVTEWKSASEKAKVENKPTPPAPRDWLADNARPGNIFSSVVYPTLGYGLKGIIWYQGESNISRAYEYAELFPFLIEQWRQEWQQEDFSFYWVQLPAYKVEQPAPGDSDWAELREAQTKTQRILNTGQAVTIDLGEGLDLHPRNKHEVATRLVRWALVHDYGMTLPYHSPEFRGLAITGNKAIVTFDCYGSNLRAFDVAEIHGFAICGADRVWHWASGKIAGKDQVEVWSDEVAVPVAVRYAWSDNPVCNLQSNDGLPVTPFRTDDFVMITMPHPPYSILQPGRGRSNP